MQKRRQYKYDRSKVNLPINPILSNRKDSSTSAMENDILKWLENVTSWRDCHQLGSKYRSYLPVRSGTKPIDPHSLLKTCTNGEDMLQYTGDVDVHNKKPNGNGEMIFENGDWFCGQFQARAE